MAAMKKMLMLMALLLAMGMTCALAEDSNEYVCDDWWYTLQDDGTAEIFLYESGEKDVTIPETLDGHPVTAIADSEYVFFNVESIVIPDSLIRIGGNPFAECDVKEIRVSPEHPTLAVIDGILYEKTEKRLVCCPSGLAYESVDIPQGIRIIGSSSFSGCYDLKSITIPDSVTTIGAWAFTSCRALEDIELPDSLTAIGDYAFNWCESLESISIPDSVADIGANPFTVCPKLTSIRVSPDSPALAVIDGVLFEKTEKRLVCYPMTLEQEAYIIPQGIRIIGASAFQFAVLTSIELPDSVTAIEAEAFLGCDMPEITLPDGLTTIGDNAFAQCKELAEITIPESVTSLGKKLFYFCSDSLTITVARDSDAARYCKENELNYTYPDALDWLTN